jgi:hypothetical protein
MLRRERIEVRLLVVDYLDLHACPRWIPCHRAS